MKTKIFVAMMLLTGIIVQANAQESIPQAIKIAFAKDHPNVSNPKWETERGNFEANWKENGADRSALYSPAGKFISSESDIAPSALPQAVKIYMSKHVSAKTKEGSKNVDADGTVTYEADAKGKAYIFDSNGNFIKMAEDD